VQSSTETAVGQECGFSQSQTCKEVKIQPFLTLHKEKPVIKKKKPMHPEKHMRPPTLSTTKYQTQAKGRKEEKYQTVPPPTTWINLTKKDSGELS